MRPRRNYFVQTALHPSWAVHQIQTVLHIPVESFIKFKQLCIPFDSSCIKFEQRCMHLSQFSHSSLDQVSSPQLISRSNSAACIPVSWAVYQIQTALHRKNVCVWKTLPSVMTTIGRHHTYLWRRLKKKLYKTKDHKEVIRVPIMELLDPLYLAHVTLHHSSHAFSEGMRSKTSRILWEKTPIYLVLALRNSTDS